MIQIIKMAFRDLRRNRRRSFFSALALGMGLALLLLMASVVTGEMRVSLETAIRLQSGHLQVQPPAYDEVKSSLAWDDLIENPAQLAAQVAALPQVAVATPRLFASGIVQEGDKTSGVRIIGIDPASEANAPYRNGLVSGAFLAADDREGVLIGQALADQMGFKTGDEIYLLVNTSSGAVAEQPFTIRGVYTTHTPAFDQSAVFMPLDKAQGIAQASNHASILFVLLKDRSQAGAVAGLLPAGRYQIKTWEQMNDMLVQTEQMADAYMIVLYLIVLAVTATVIVNTLIMSVFERTREIGILSAIGMKSSGIMALFFAESSLLAVGGIVIGLAIGGLMVLYASRVGFFIGNMGISGILLGERIYGYLTLKDTITLTIIAFIVTLLAARMEPVEALHAAQ